MLSEFRLERRYADGIHVEWSPETLHQLLRRGTAGRAGHRRLQPRALHPQRAATATSCVQSPASGLVTALEPVMRACGGTWIAHGSGSADRETVDAHDRVARAARKNRAYTLRRVWLTRGGAGGYYYGFANEGFGRSAISPSCGRSSATRTGAITTRSTSASPTRSSRRPTRDDPIVLVQDYHFALLPQHDPRAAAEATIITFWHIPWPNPETFGICPWREEIIDGLLGSSDPRLSHPVPLQQLPRDRRPLPRGAHRPRAARGLARAARTTLVRPYPISIEWPPAALRATAAGGGVPRRGASRASACPTTCASASASTASTTPRAFSSGCCAVERLLEQHPEWRGQFVFVQVGGADAQQLARYSALQARGRAAGRARSTSASATAATSRSCCSMRHHEPHEVFELLPRRRLCFVSQPARRHEPRRQGIRRRARRRAGRADPVELFAGAARELTEALIVNPYDTRRHGRRARSRRCACRRAEQRERMRRCASWSAERNVYRWAGQMLLDAARLRQRESISGAEAA